ncbi:hypothetical protein Bca52824_019476 [Brassica carinata]|uniref:Uncharacterized protein n=1 Tax=Brassica carinata TaxID=52824 RepID=A0A8X7VRU5_BRACI|nr:hypothetical protein Bca52824_019476 [Brassica carinata]
MNLVLLQTTSSINLSLSFFHYIGDSINPKLRQVLEKALEDGLFEFLLCDFAFVTAPGFHVRGEALRLTGARRHATNPSLLLLYNPDLYLIDGRDQVWCFWWLISHLHRLLFRFLCGGPPWRILGSGGSLVSTVTRSVRGRRRRARDATNHLSGQGSYRDEV